MFTSSERAPGGDMFVMTSPGFSDEQTEAYHDPLDDVFGSAPSSPVISPEDQRIARQVEPSDIPRLRSTHVTNGYREGIAAGKEQSIQAGFDEGYALGAEYGHIAGWIIGVLDGLLSCSISPEARTEVERLIQLAKIELDLSSLFGTEYFGQDGIWTYALPEQSNEETTFRMIARAHPLLLKWRELTIKTAEMYDFVL